MFNSATKPIVKKVSLNQPIDLNRFFVANKPKSAWITIIPIEEREITGYEYVSSGKAFQEDENDAVIDNKDDLKKYLSALKNG